MGMERARNLILVSPTRVDGLPGRILTYPDGSVRVQKWVNRRWVTDENRIVGQPQPKPAADDTLANYTVGAAAN
jgi:hypothetical protein